MPVDPVCLGTGLLSSIVGRISLRDGARCRRRWAPLLSPSAAVALCLAVINPFGTPRWTPSRQQLLEGVMRALRVPVVTQLRCSRGLDARNLVGGGRTEAYVSPGGLVDC